MAVPQRRTSKTRKRLRRSHQALTPATLTVCEHCGAKIKPHTVCRECGYYRGKKVIEVKSKND